MKNFYEILNVPENASLNDINKSYRKLCLLWHPDKNSDPLATERFAEIGKAFDTLKDSDKRSQYDRIRLVRRHYDHLNDSESEPTQLKGYLSYHERAFSDKLKKKYRSFHLKFIKNPLSFRAIKKDNTAENFFSQLKIKINSHEAPLLTLLENKTLTPNLAVDVFRKFMKGDCHLKDYIWLKDTFEEELKKTEHLSDKDRPLASFLYRGILDVICMLYEESKRCDLLAALQNILFYAKKSSLNLGSIHMQFFALLLQDKNFTTLFEMSLKQYWQDPNQNKTDFIHLLFTSDQDEKLEKDEVGTENLYQHLLYCASKVFKKKLGDGLEPKQIRETAYYCLDYIRVLNATPVVALNLILHAAYLFQKAAKEENDPFLKMADEALTIHLCKLAITISRENAPLLDLYVHTHCVCIIQGLQYEHLDMDINLLLEVIKRHALNLANFFPYFDPIQSHLNLLTSQKENLKLMRDHLHQMVHYVNHNAIQLTKETEVPLEQTSCQILNQAYDASLRGWYEENFLTETEKELRLASMEALLDKGGFSWRDIYSNGIGLNRDSQGWLKTGLPLPYTKDEIIYKSLDGLEIDFETADIHFALNRWTTQDPIHKKAFSNFHVGEMITKGIYDVAFSLDPIDSELPHNPFQQQVFYPSHLYKTDFLNNLFASDYLLKFFTTGFEVQGEYPYEIRSINPFIQHLPEHLKKIIQDYHAQEKNGETHRFWIETQNVMANMEHTKDKFRLSLGDVRLVVKTHKMMLNNEGKLVDERETNEGWNLYILSQEQIEEVRNKTRFLETPAIILTRNVSSAHFYEDGYLFQNSIHLKKEEMIGINALNVDENFKVCPPSMKKEIKDEKKATDYDYHHFLYCLTTSITKQANKPHLFTHERVFAEEFTIHFDEFAQYFPEFERLKQLNKIACMIHNMKIIRAWNLAIKEEKENEFNNPLFWKKIEEETIKLIYPKQREHFVQMFKKIKEEQSNDLIKIRAGAQEIYEIIKNDLIKQARFENEIKQEYRNQLYNLHIFLVNNGYLQATAYNQCIDQFMNGSIESLAQAIAGYNCEKELSSLKEKYNQIYPDSKNFVQDAYHGNPNQLATIISEHSAKIEIENLKELYRSEIKKLSQLEISFETLGLGKDEKKIDLSKKCTWVPASIWHEIWHEEDNQYLRFIYGGVRLKPTITLRSKISQQTAALLLASSITLTPPPSYAAFLNNQSNAQWEIDKAIRLASDVEWQVKMLKWSNPLMRADISEVDRMLSDFTYQIRNAQFKIQMPPPPKVDPYVDKGFEHKSVQQKNMPLFGILQGNSMESGFEFFPSDSTRCKLGKAGMNSLMSEIYDPDNYGMSHALENITFFKRLKMWQQVLDEECRPPTEEDLKYLKEKEKNKSLLELTPQEAADLAKITVSKAKNFFLNFFEKRKKLLDIPDKDEAYKWERH